MVFGYSTKESTDGKAFEYNPYVENSGDESEEVSSNYYMGYKYCPICGDEPFTSDHVCITEKTLIYNRPRFFIGDIKHYNDGFLREIIIWQDRYISTLLEKLKEVDNGQGNKKVDPTGRG